MRAIESLLQKRNRSTGIEIGCFRSARARIVTSNMAAFLFYLTPT
jgi:hypothetical protein